MGIENCGIALLTIVSNVLNYTSNIVENSVRHMDGLWKIVGTREVLFSGNFYISATLFLKSPRILGDDGICRQIGYLSWLRINLKKERLFLEKRCAQRWKGNYALKSAWNQGSWDLFQGQATQLFQDVKHYIFLWDRYF